MLQFIVFTDQKQVIAHAAHYGWRGVLLPSSVCRPRDFKIHPNSTNELRGFDYTAYLPISSAASDAISLGAILQIVTHHLASGPSVALLVRRRGNIRGGGVNRTMLFASVVIRRSGGAADAFSCRWLELATGSTHTKEQVTLEAALREPAAATRVVTLDLHSAKKLTYPSSPNTGSPNPGLALTPSSRKQMPHTRDQSRRRKVVKRTTS